MELLKGADSVSNIELLLIRKTQLHRKIQRDQEQIKDARLALGAIDREIYSKCIHYFTRDESAAHDDIYKRSCVKCGLYQNYNY